MISIWPLTLLYSPRSGEDGAGQYEEHEAARSLHPLMFDFPHEASPRRLSLRIGKLHQKTQMRPIASFGVDISKPAGHVSLKCARGAARPDKVYDLSFECSKGAGEMAHTTMVKIVSRYVLENQSSHRMLYAQWFQINNQLPL